MTPNGKIRRVAVIGDRALCVAYRFRLRWFCFAVWMEAA